MFQEIVGSGKYDCKPTKWGRFSSLVPGNWWLAASSWQQALSYITSCTEFSGETSNHPDDSAPLKPRFDVLWLLAFPKTNITFERENISYHWWDLGKYDGAADGDWENCGRPKVLTLKGTEASLSYVTCFLYLVSSINFSTFHVIWMDTFWTDYIYMCVCIYVCVYDIHLIKFHLLCI